MAWQRTVHVDTRVTPRDRALAAIPRKLRRLEWSVWLWLAWLTLLWGVLTVALVWLVG